MASASLSCPPEADLIMILERAAHIAQQAFYFFRINTYEYHISGITFENDEVFVHDCEGDLEKPFVGFNDNIHPDKSFKAAALTYNMCNDALVRMKGLVQLLLGGIATDYDLKEIRVAFKDDAVPPRKTTALLKESLNPRPRVACNWPSHHDILDVSPNRGGEHFYIDLTFAQYGFKGPIMPAADYWSLYGVAQVCYIDPSAEAADPEHNATVGPLLFEAQKVMYTAVDDWEIDHKMNLAKLVTLKDSSYETLKINLLTAISSALTKFAFRAEYPPGYLDVDAEAMKKLEDRIEALERQRGYLE